MVFELADIEDLYNSVQILHNGHIPYRFVSPLWLHLVENQKSRFEVTVKVMGFKSLNFLFIGFYK